MRDAILSTIAVIIVVVSIVLGILFLVQLIQATHPITGKITKLWTQGALYRYAVIESDGKRQSLDVSPRDFVLLEVGLTCTFQVDSDNETHGVVCEASK